MRVLDVDELEYDVFGKAVHDVRTLVIRTYLATVSLLSPRP